MSLGRRMGADVSTILREVRSTGRHRRMPMKCMVLSRTNGQAWVLNVADWVIRSAMKKRHPMGMDALVISRAAGSFGHLREGQELNPTSMICELVAEKLGGNV